MPIRYIDAREAKRLVDDGASLIDVREPAEFAAEFIPGARNYPLSTIVESRPKSSLARIIFHCKSGGRTRSASAHLELSSQAEAYILDSGIDGWKAAGYATKRG
jgi:rhodanese-related sulfurtransferase